MPRLLSARAASVPKHTARPDSASASSLSSHAMWSHATFSVIVYVEFHLNGARRVLRIRLDVLVGEAEFADALAQFAAQVVAADARHDDRLVAELVAVEREVERRPARDLAAVGVDVPQQFADPDDGVHVAYPGERPV